MKGLALIALALWAACIWQHEAEGEVHGGTAVATAIATLADLIWVVVS